MPSSSRRRGHRSRGRRCRGRKDCLPSPAEWRDWAGLPHDLLCLIISQLPQTDILRGAAGQVCASWRRVAVHEPLLWRRIDLVADEGKDDEMDEPVGWQAMARAAVDRSAGQCEYFRGHVDGDFLLYLADSAPSLRRLHVTSWSFSKNGKGFITGAAELKLIRKKLPLLEEPMVSGGPHGRICKALLKVARTLPLVLRYPRVRN